MAAYLNRTISMVTGNGTSSSTTYDANSLTDSPRNLHNSSVDNSPLQVFVRAKKRINDIFVEIEEYVVETSHFIDGKPLSNVRLSFSPANNFLLNVDHPGEVKIVDAAESQQFQSYVQKVAGIRSVLSRDHMKVAFFGRTSNGKSSVINAMLRERILPSGIGHTTNCFCQVEGINGTEAYLVKEDSDEKLNVTVSIKTSNHSFKIHACSSLVEHQTTGQCTVQRGETERKFAG